MNAETGQPVVVGLGELLWDCFDESRRAGGAPANVAFQADQLGCAGVVCSRVGTDSDGDELIRFLEQQDVNTKSIQRDDTRPTGWVTVDTSTPGSPDYEIHKNVAWDAIEFTPEVERLAQSSAAICFGTLAQRAEISRETIHRCLSAAAPSCLKVYDVNFRQRWYRREWIEPSLQKADILKLNHKEIAALSEMFGVNGDDAPAFAEDVQGRFNIQLVCVTRAQNGCLLVEGNHIADIPGRKVDVVDAVGAGDAFTAALIFARLHDWPLQAAGEFANAVGGLVTTRAGAMPPLRNEFQELKRQYA